MKKENRKNFYIAICMLAAFVLWTISVRFIDVQAVGPQGSTIGFSTINLFVHRLTDVHMSLYIITDWLGLVPLAVCVGFGILGFIQLVRRKSILKVDYDILALGGFYIVVIAIYLLFEMLVINYRPVLINGALEVSYPSSTTMLVMSIMPTSIMQFNARIKSGVLKRCLTIIIIAFIVFVVGGRLVSGVHWLSDIIGGAILSAGLVLMYGSISGLNKK